MKDSKEPSPAVKDTANGNESRNPDGTFKKGSPEAAQAGHVGGLHAAGKEDTVSPSLHLYRWLSPITDCFAAPRAPRRRHILAWLRGGEGGWT